MLCLALKFRMWPCAYVGFWVRVKTDPFRLSIWVPVGSCFQKKIARIRERKCLQFLVVRKWMKSCNLANGCCEAPFPFLFSSLFCVLLLLPFCTSFVFISVSLLLREYFGFCLCRKWKVKENRKWWNNWTDKRGDGEVGDGVAQDCWATLSTSGRGLPM